LIAAGVADVLDLSAQPGHGVRALRLLGMAEAHNLCNECAGVIHIIGCAARESAETVRLPLPARVMLVDLAQRQGAVQQDAREVRGCRRHRAGAATLRGHSLLHRTDRSRRRYGALDDARSGAALTGRNACMSCRLAITPPLVRRIRSISCSQFRSRVTVFDVFPA